MDSIMCHIYIYIYFFLHKENSLELNIALVLCRGALMNVSLNMSAILLFQ